MSVTSLVCGKARDQGSLQEAGSRRTGVRHHHGASAGRQHDGEQQVRVDIVIQKKKGGARVWRRHKTFEISSPVPSDTPSPMRSYFLSLPKQLHNCGPGSQQELISAILIHASLDSSMRMCGVCTCVECAHVWKQRHGYGEQRLRSGALLDHFPPYLLR